MIKLEFVIDEVSDGITCDGNYEIKDASILELLTLEHKLRRVLDTIEGISENMLNGIPLEE